MTIYETITNAVINAIEKNEAGAWVMPWHRASGFSMPINVVSKKPYNGSNVLMLWITSIEKGYSSDIWGTYKQWQELGAQVRQGEQSTHIGFFKKMQGKPAEGEEEGKVFGMLKPYFVFNSEQVDGWQAPTVEKPVVADPAAIMESVDHFVTMTGAVVKTGEARAYYVPSMDYINMPCREAFTGSPTSSPTECYYSTLLHELSHWTGAEKRLNREFKKKGQESYALEELVAELSAAFLCATLGITSAPRPDHAQYINHWLTALKGDSRVIFTAASAAQKAADYLHGLQMGEMAAAA